MAVKKAKHTVVDCVSPSGSLDNDCLLRALFQVRNTPDPDYTSQQGQSLASPYGMHALSSAGKTNSTIPLYGQSGGNLEHSKRMLYLRDRMRRHLRNFMSMHNYGHPLFWVTVYPYSANRVPIPQNETNLGQLWNGKVMTNIGSKLLALDALRCGIHTFYASSPLQQ